MKNIFVIILLIFSVITANAQGQNKKTKKERRAEKQAQLMKKVKKLVDGKVFVFDARTANPLTGNTINLTSLYNVRLENDSIFSYLPYYGRAYRVEYGSLKSPLNFDAPIQIVSSEKTKNGYLVKVNVKNGSDNLDYSFNVTETGSTLLSVNSSDRQVISFYGEIDTTEKRD